MPTEPFENTAEVELAGATFDAAWVTTSTTDHNVTTPAYEVTPLIHFRDQVSNPRRFQVLQQWEGVVTRIDGDWFEADLRDLSTPDNPPEVAEFPITDITASERPLIRPGCVFYWVIGIETRKGGQITRSSEIRLRRAPLWTQRKLDEMKARARELFTLEGEDAETIAQPK